VKNKYKDYSIRKILYRW